ncbi:unnamed protein product [Tuber melanosporum]|uniref:L-lactate dehydrogenase (cytochrome) n=1 Tax=Tuber melanosporum (strain Mel28) TaxID=656061 RepID=D5GHV8_TUBMM|nr:uncharacterized protein GSTUM_00008138001 [Tuber melanosporum]CAZ84101.1 unnamed protein product [Tuber melanosporum]
MLLNRDSTTADNCRQLPLTQRKVTASWTPLQTAIANSLQVAKHNTSSSCWVIIHNTVYDVTDFLSAHPGGAKAILSLAGQDATEEYDPIHPPGTLEESLEKSQILGPVDPSTIITITPTPSLSSSPSEKDKARDGIPPLAEQLNLDDFAITAEKVLSPKAWAYYFSASDDQLTKRHNNTAYQQILLRPRIFKDVRNVDTRTTMCSSSVAFPVFVAPAAMARLAHPSGEAGIAEACGREGVLQCVSTNASLKPEQVMAGRVSDKQPSWFQLYVQEDRRKSEALLKRVGTLGFTAVVLTLDAPTPGKREADERAKNAGNITSATFGESMQGKSESGGLGKALFAGTTPSLTWEDLEWLRKHTRLPIILKGLQTHEDAAMAARKEVLELGVTGIILSNHGGRAADTAPPPVYVLMEIRKYAPEVFDKLEVYVDGGIRRGTDVVKALCLGAKAVGIGRPALFGLSGYGVDGVRRVLAILREEIETTMRLLGVYSVGELGSRHINTRALDGLIYQEPQELSGGVIKAKL